MSTNTTNFGFTLPAVNSATDEDLWGSELNTNLSSQDSLLLTLLNFTPSTKTANFSVTGPTAGSATTGSSKILYLCDATAGTITASLPAAATASGMVVGFKKTDAGANTVILDANGSETIDGALTKTISTQYDFLVLECDGTGWNIIGQGIAGLAPLASPAFTGNPTAPTATVNDSDTSIATTAFANPARSLAANGYVKLPSGVIMQWGVDTAAGNPRTINFPTSFATACYSVMTNLSSFTTVTTAVTAISTTQFTIQQSSGTGANIYFFAVGV